MKLKSILQIHSSPERLVIVTDPPLAQDVFDAFLKLIQDDKVRSAFSLIDGRLGYASKMFSRKDANDLQCLLQNADQAVREQKELDEGNRLAFLKYISEQSGLPLE